MAQRKFKNELVSKPFNFIEKNSKVTLNLAKLEVGDRNFMDIRDHVLIEDSHKPSKKGIAIEFKHVPDVLSAIQKIKDENISTSEDYLAVLKIDKGSTKKLYVGLTNFQDKLLVDIREYYRKGEDESSYEWCPSPKGNQFAKELLGDVINLIQEFCDEYSIEY